MSRPKHNLEDVRESYYTQKEEREMEELKEKVYQVEVTEEEYNLLREGDYQDVFAVVESIICQVSEQEVKES